MNRTVLIGVVVCLWSGGALAKTCTVTGGTVAFGIYDPTAVGNLTTIGSLTVQCDGNIDAILSINLGSGSGANYISGRRMTGSSGGTLRYNLYANASYTTVLGDGTGGSVTLNIKGKKSWYQAIWASMPARQTTVLTGNYSDSVVATISY